MLGGVNKNLFLLEEQHREDHLRVTEWGDKYRDEVEEHPTFGWDFDGAQDMILEGNGFIAECLLSHDGVRDQFQRQSFQCGGLLINEIDS